MLNMLFDCLFWVYPNCIHLVLLLLLENSLSCLLIVARYLLDSSSIYASSIEISGFVLYTFRQIAHPSSQFFFGVSVCSIDAQYPLDLSKSFFHQFLLDTSRSIEFLFSIEARYLLDISSYIFLYIYIYMRFDLIHFKLKYLDTSHFSLDPILFFSQKSLFPSRFQPCPSIHSLASVLNIIFSPSFMHFMHFVTQVF